MSDRYLLTKSGSAAYREDIVSALERPTMRPVVVIDPEDREQVGRLIEAFVNEGGFEHGGGRDNMQSAFRSLIAPRKPPAPTGLGAVVEDADGEQWVRNDLPDGPAWRTAGGGGLWRTYCDIAAVKVLSEGVTA